MQNVSTKPEGKKVGTKAAAKKATAHAAAEMGRGEELQHPQDPAPAFLGDSDGVAVSAVKEGFSLVIPFDRQLQAIMDRIPNASFHKEGKYYLVPAASAAVLGDQVRALRKMSKSIAEDMGSITELATQSARKLQEDNGNFRSKPQVNGYREAGRGYQGEIINANTHYVAQFTGFGKEDGAAFVTIHRLVDLNQRNLLKGDKVRIQYDDRMLGVVSDLSQSRTVAQMTADFEKHLGQQVDGVTLTTRGDNIGVAFAMHPVLAERIRKVDGAAFHKGDRVWEVPKRNQEYALRAADDMRKEFALDKKDVQLMGQIAEEKIDGAKVRHAFAKDGQRHFGIVFAVSDRYALQKTGRDEFSLHHLSALSQKPTVNQNLSIEYNKGKGSVVDQNLLRAHDKAVGASR